MIALTDKGKRNQKVIRDGRGFVCPNCGDERLRVTHTVARDDGVIERRRRCNECAHVTYTEERSTIQ